MKARFDFKNDEEFIEYLRTYFAAMAMQGIASKQGGLDSYDWDFIAIHSVKSADALISALNQHKPNQP